ncbi:MAG: hypothetical protein ABII00_08415 [Elusimicrobiota bacterium]
MGAYAVLISDESIDYTALGQALAKAKKMPFQDAIPVARKCGGLIEEDMEAEAAEALAADLKGAGLDARAVAQDSLARLPPALPVKTLALGEGSFRITLEGNETLDVPLDTIALVAAAAFTVSTEKTVVTQEGSGAAAKALEKTLRMATMMPIKFTKETKIQKRGETDLLLYMDLYLRDPAKRLRMDSAALDYRFLGEKMTYSSLTNFRLLVQGMAKLAASAVLNMGTKIIAENRPMREMAYASLDDLDRESRCILSVRGDAPPKR